MVEENFEIWLSEMPQIGLILLFFFSPKFTMVEENFEISLSETPQIGLILLYGTPKIPEVPPGLVSPPRVKEI